jgi:hypothetical protein
MMGTQIASDGDFNLAIQPEPEIETSEKNIKMEKFFYEINVLLGGTSIELNLIDDDYRIAFNRALEEYRQISSNSIYESYGFLETQPNTQAYILHRAIDNVIHMYRKRSLFDSNNTGFDYFSQIAAGMIYPGSQPGGYLGIATYDFALQYEETLNRVFARDFRYQFYPWSNTLYLLQVPRDREMVIMRCAVLKTITELMSDHWARIMLQRLTIAILKGIIANKWGKFSTVPSAQGGAQINWQKFAAESKEEMAKCHEDIWNMQDNSIPAYPQMM